MPHFYFHIRNSEGEILDPEGSNCPDLDAARREAIVGLRSIISEEIRHGRLPLDERLDIEDKEGRVLLSVGFLDAVTLPLGVALHAAG